LVKGDILKHDIVPELHSFGDGGSMLKKNLEAQQKPEELERSRLIMTPGTNQT
jgi:hypothetical protein